MGAMPKILLHTCCGPCTIYPLEWLRKAGWIAHGFFYNPNIHPYQEQQRRLHALCSLAEDRELGLIVRPEYELEHFLRQVVFREENRCFICYSLRIEATAKLALKSKFDAFTSTLLYSKHQKHDLIRSIAEDAAGRHGIPFLYEDFRVGWSEGQEAAKAMGLYRQPYCGCIYSEGERYYRPGKKPTAQRAAAFRDTQPEGGPT
jgi:epoxyqueuosine reductase